MAENEELEQRAVERLAEDERLRGELTDFGYEPLLKWATEAVSNFVNSHPVTEQEVDTYTNKIRDALSNVVELASSGKLNDPAALAQLDLPAAQKEVLVAQVQAFKPTDDPDANAEGLAAILQTSLTQAASQAQSLDTSATPPASEPPTKASPAEEQPESVANLVDKKKENTTDEPAHATVAKLVSEPTTVGDQAEPDQATGTEPVAISQPVADNPPTNAETTVSPEKVAAILETIAAKIPTETAEAEPEKLPTSGLDKLFGSVKNFFLGKPADAAKDVSSDHKETQEAEK